MSRRQQLVTSAADTKAIDEAVGRAAAQFMDEIAVELVRLAKEKAMEMGLQPQYAGACLAYATGRFCAESAANVAHLGTIIDVAKGSMDQYGRGVYNDRIDGQRLIRGIEGLPLKRA